MKKILGVFVIVLMLIGGFFNSYSLSISDFIRILLGWNYTEILRECTAQAIDENGNIIRVRGAYIVCEAGNTSCTATSCTALRP